MSTATHRRFVERSPSPRSLGDARTDRSPCVNARCSMSVDGQRKSQSVRPIAIHAIAYRVPYAGANRIRCDGSISATDHRHPLRDGSSEAGEGLFVDSRCVRVHVEADGVRIRHRVSECHRRREARIYSSAIRTGDDARHDRIFRMQMPASRDAVLNTVSLLAPPRISHLRRPGVADT